MSLIVETGSGSSSSESYISVADADLYFSNRGNATWATLTTQVKEQLLRKGTDYLGQAYRLSWKGSIVSVDQALDWPRNYVERVGYSYIYIANNIVPNEVKHACAELALRANSGDLSPDLSQLVTREKIDVIETEYSEYSAQSPRYTAIDKLLQPYLTGSSYSMKVIRT